MKKITIKRAISILLIVAMVCTNAGIASFAAENPQTVETADSIWVKTQTDSGQQTEEEEA